MNPVIIIAEAGVNHNGNISIAKKLIDAAAEAGVDYVKFQTFKADKLASKSAAKAEYQISNSAHKQERTQYAMLKKLELSVKQHIVLKEYCRKRKVKFLSTPFDEDSLAFLLNLKMDMIKVPSGEITNLPYLEKVAQAKKKIILSTGMATLKEIGEAVTVFTKKGIGKKDITILHCNTGYPTPYCDVNLRAMSAIRKKFGVNIGYSDHTMGIEVPIAAVALGATVIEKHFTLDRNMEGPDHKASLEPEELKQMVLSIRNIELAMGTGVKSPTKSELKNISVARKSIVAKADIKKGEIFSDNNIAIKRPGNGISPMKWYKVLGKKASRNYKADELI